MMENEKRFTAVQRCPHCGVEAQMEIVGSHSRVKRDVRERDGNASNPSAIVYELLSCPACDEVTLRSSNDLVPPQQNEQDIQPLSPESSNRRSASIPDSFKAAYAATYAFRKLDPVAYAAMIRHLATIRECNRHKRI